MTKLTDEPLYNLKAVVQRTGIPAASLRAWEKRYGILSPIRKPNGHRVYPASEIAKLQRLKTLMAQGMTISQAADQLRAAVPPKSAQLTEVDRLGQRLERALEKLDTHGANRAVAEALELLPADKFCLRIIRPLLGGLTPFGQTFLRLKLGALLLHASPLPGARLAVALTPDPLALEPLLAAVLLSRTGHRVIYVEGADLPAGLRPDLVIDPRPIRGRVTPADYLDRLV